MRKNKMIAKACPDCQQQVPVACKNCPCGFSFYNCKKRGVSPSLEILKLFVNEQRKREKPNFYDSLIYDKQLKRKKALLKPTKKSQTHPSSSSNDEDNLGEKKENSRQKRIKKNEDQYEKILNSLTEEKSIQCKYILEELNRKIRLVSCQSFL